VHACACVCVCAARTLLAGRTNSQTPASVCVYVCFCKGAHVIVRGLER